MADYAQGNSPASPFGDVAFMVRKDKPGDLAGADGAIVAQQGDSSGCARQTEEGGALTYYHNSQFACDATGTNIWILAGVATKVLKVLWLRISSVATGAATGRLTVRRQSAVDTDGTPVSGTIAKADSGNAAAAAQAKHYTAHPTALGATAGVLTSLQYGQQAVGALPVNEVLIDFRNRFGAQGLVLRGIAELLAINVEAALGGAGNLWDITACAKEDSLTS